MAVSMIQKIKDLKETSFRFTSFERKMTTPNDLGERKILIVFELHDVIETVEGSTVLYDPEDRALSANVYAQDVTHVNCMLDNIEKYESEFTFDVDAEGNLTRSGSYHGDMFLDVSTSRREVWLTDTKLSKYGQDKRKENKKEQFKLFFNRVK